MGVRAEFEELSFSAALGEGSDLTERLDRVIRDAPFGVYVDRPQHGCVYANRALLEQFGLRWDEFSGFGWARHIHPDDAEALQARIHEYELSPGVIDVRYRVTRGDGALRWIRARVEAQLDAAGRHVGSVGTTEDITDAEELRNHTAESQKLQVVGRLSGGVAHDFNNLMTAIMGSSELLRFEVGSDRGHECLDTIDLALEQGRQVTEKLLMLARRRPDSPGVICLDEQLRSLALLLKTTLGAKIRLVLDLDAGESHIPLDEGQFGQLVLNLATNGSDAMNGEGALAIRTRRHGPHAVLEVEDGGCGMDAETRQWMFAAFFTTKRAEQGVGLGLSIVKDLVELASGTIEVDSAPGQGTKMLVKIPSVAAPTRGSSRDAPRDEKRLRRSERLLLVEDHDGLRQSLGYGLAIYGYAVQTARTIAEAERRFATDGFDVVVCDVLLPDGEGTELGRRLRAERDGLPLVYISGFTGEARIERELAEPLTRYLAKPFSPHDLVVTLCELLERVD